MKALGQHVHVREPVVLGLVTALAAPLALLLAGGLALGLGALALHLPRPRDRVHARAVPHRLDVPTHPAVPSAAWRRRSAARRAALVASARSTWLQTIWATTQITT